MTPLQDCFCRGSVDVRTTCRMRAMGRSAVAPSERGAPAGAQAVAAGEVAAPEAGGAYLCSFTAAAKGTSA